MNDSKADVGNLAAWLTPIWDEEERLAKACLGVNVLAGMRRGIEPPRWVRDGSSIYDDRPDSSGPPIVRVRHSWAREIDHIILHDPASVLARIAADRKILELHSYHMTASLDSHFKRITGTEHPRCDTCASQDENGEQWPCETLRLLASLYKGREGWQEAWRV